MYAIIKTGGKQYQVIPGQKIAIELLEATEAGTEFEFNEVLFAFDGSETHIGGPLLTNFPVYAKVLGIIKGEKTKGLKYKRSHNQCRQWGHRQKYLEVEITGMGKKHQKKESKHGA